MPRRCSIRWSVALLLSLAAGPVPAAEPAFPRVPPRSPADAARAFHVQQGFQLQLLAAEPLLTDPVAIAYDEDGRAYVAEMRDYPYTDKARHKPGQENPGDQPIGRIRLLHDDDGDGRFERSTVFAEGLSWPTGVACWRGGIFVAASPDIWYFRDTDGDGVADVRERWFTGFRKLNVQAVMNNLQWGLDNRLHGAGGSNGGLVESLRLSQAPAQRLARHDFAFDPRTGRLELLAGGARFGLAFDDWGHRFLCNIRNPAQHVVLPLAALARNPFLTAINPVHDVAEAGDQLPVYRTSPPEPWREVRARRWTAEAKVMPRSELVGAGVVTSSSGLVVYRGGAYPPEYRGQIFVADVAGNLFYRLRREPDGATFTARRADERVDFATSEDIWFRPVNLVNAPDGTLHVLDMYRETIEHPWSIPDDLHAQLDLESGRDRGRLYRLAPPGFTVPKPPRLGRATGAELVGTLGSPHSWWRETAQRLLVERQDPASIAPLRALLGTGRDPLARLHALWTLHGLQALTADDVLTGLGDDAPELRAQAVRLGEAWLHPAANRQNPGMDRLRNRIRSLAADPDPRVRFQVALSLGVVADPAHAPVLADLAWRSRTDPWTLTAVLTGTTNCAAGVFQALVRHDESGTNFFRTPAGRSFARQLGRTAGAVADGANLAACLAGAPVSLEFAVGLAEGLRLARRPLSTLPAEEAWRTRMISTARQAVAERAETLEQRLAGVEILVHYDPVAAAPHLLARLEPVEPTELQTAALRGLVTVADAGQLTTLLARWPQLSPALRNELVAQCSARADRALLLLAALEQGTIPAGQLSASRRAALTGHRDAAVQAQAKRVLGDERPGARSEVIQRFQPALRLAGDPRRGAEVHQQLCAACHRFGPTGKDVGPNLATVRTWSAEQLLTNILDPNREVAPAFVAYAVELQNGETREGIITAETADALALRQADGSEINVARRDITRLSSSGLSLMPEGLEATLTAQSLADLLAFLRQDQPSP